MVAHSRFTNARIHDGIDFVADTKQLFGTHLMRTNALHRIVGSLNFGDERIQLVAVEHSAVANLAAGFSIKRRVIKDDFALFSRLELLHSLAILDYGKHFT